MVNVYSVTRLNATQVELRTAAVKELSTHRLTVSNVKDVGGHVIDPAHDSLTFLVQDLNPQLASATVTALDTIQCVFSEAMSDVGLTTITNYVFTGPSTLTTASVTKISSTTVDVVITEEMRNGSTYTITVSNVTDSGGKVIDPDNDAQDFVGSGVAPQVSSATFVDTTHFDITFNEAMNQTSMETNTNYTITAGPVSPTITAAVKQTTTRVRLTASIIMTPGDYTAHVINVTDVAGNVIDPAHDTGSFYSPYITNWTEISPLTIPSSRLDYAMAYDSTRSLSVMFGGYEGGTGIRLQDTWEWNGTDWVLRLPAHKPSNRQYSEMAYDVSRSVSVLFGGYTGLENNETWEWDGTDWTQRAPASSPSVRYGHGMAYDSSRNVTVLFGGVTGGARDDQTWEYDGTTWTQKFPASKPSARAYPRVVYDSHRNVTVLFGGSITGGTGYDDETWEYNGTTWTMISPAVKPSGRYWHAMMFDSDRDLTVLHGGSTAAGTNGQTYEWNGTIWRLMSPAASPGNRRAHQLVFDTSRAVGVMFGGHTGFIIENDTWEYAEV